MPPPASRVPDYAGTLSILLSGFVMLILLLPARAEMSIGGSDADLDGLSDDDEQFSIGTDPLRSDTDGDGAGDGLEVILGFDPLLSTSRPAAGWTLAGITDPGTVGPYLDGVLPDLAPGGGTGPWQTVNAFPLIPRFGQNPGTGLPKGLIGVAAEPRRNFLFVLERSGKVRRVANDPSATSAELILNLESLVDPGDNGGLRTLVFHPEYNDPASPNKDYLYVFYSTSATAAHGFTRNPDGSFFYRVSRFTRGAEGIIALESELVLIQQRSRDRGQHFGGGMVFGADGFLYVGWGDMEYLSSRIGVPFYQDVQRIDRIFQGAILCLDVDRRGGSVSTPPIRTLQGNNPAHPHPIPGSTQSCPPGHNYHHEDNFSGVGYFIPRTNYWHRDNHVPPPGLPGTTEGVAYPVHGPTLEEHVAVGVRNPWRMAADPLDGHVAWFNVGSNSQGANSKHEEAEVLIQGGNYGWPHLEGTSSETSETGRSVPPGETSFAPVSLGTRRDPVAFHDHTLGNCASGGVMYRGARYPALYGKLLYADHSTGRIWSVDYKSRGDFGNAGAPVVTLVHDSSSAIRQMTTSADEQDLLLANHDRILRLEPIATPNPEPPTLLSQTGAFTDLATLTPRPGLLPYEPIAPLWSDRALKRRWIAVPNTLGAPGRYDHPDEKIVFSENQDWTFPRGTVLVKHFALPLDERDPINPAKQKRLETRFEVRTEDGSYTYYTYKWNAGDTDAILVPAGESTGYNETWDITRSDGSTYQQTWRIPSRAQCLSCHQEGANQVLGVRTSALNGPMSYPSTGQLANQLATMNSLAMFDLSFSVSSLRTVLTAAAITDETATLEHRVKSYLDVNCSHCHRPGAESGRATFDALLATPLSQMGILNAPPRAEPLGLSDPRIVRPGDPANSLLYHRDLSLDPLVAMPPLGRSLVDEQYIEVLTKWIERIGFPNFDAWATVGGVIGGITDDFDQDQFNNAVEFLIGQDGAVPNPHALINWSLGPDHRVEVRIPIEGDALADGLILDLIDTGDLITWHPAGTPGSVLTLKSDSSAPGVDGTMIWEWAPGYRFGFLRMRGRAP